MCRKGRRFCFTTSERELKIWLADCIWFLIYLHVTSHCVLKPGKIVFCWLFFVLNSHWSSSVPMLELYVRPLSLKHQWVQHSRVACPLPLQWVWLTAQILSSKKCTNTYWKISFLFFSPLCGIRENRFFHTIALGLLCDCFFLLKHQSWLL